MEEFLCKECGQIHEFSNVIKFEIPRQFISLLYVDKLDYESSERWFIIDNKYYFVRGLITIPIYGYKNDFSWIVWIEVDEEDFISFINELSSANEVKNYMGKGRLFLDINLVGAEQGLDVMYSFRTTKSFPSIEIIDKGAGLSKFCENGISKESAFKIMSLIYH